jgi:hypothetical protein
MEYIAIYEKLNKRLIPNLSNIVFTYLFHEPSKSKIYNLIIISAEDEGIYHTSYSNRIKSNLQSRMKREVLGYMNEYYFSAIEEGLYIPFTVRDLACSSIDCDDSGIVDFDGEKRNLFKNEDCLTTIENMEVLIEEDEITILLMDCNSRARKAKFQIELQ